MPRLGRSQPFPPKLSKFALGIQFDAAANSGYQAAGGANPFTVSASWNGSNRMLSIDVSILSVTDTVTAMTYGGAVCTFVGAQNVVGGVGRVEQWRICQNDSGAPGAGSNTLSVTLSGSVAYSIEWTSYTGVNQATPTEAFSGNSGVNAGSATNATVVVTPVTNLDWVHAALATSQSSGIASSQRSRNVVAGALGTGANADTGPISPVAAQTMTWTGEGVTSGWATAGYGIVPQSFSNNWIRTITDAPTLSESLARVFVGLRTTTDAPTLSESLTRSFAGLRAATDSTTLSESLSRTFVGSRTTSDALTLSESIARALIASRTATDALTLSESVARVSVVSRTTVDAPTLSESVVRTVMLFRTATDGLTLSESVTRALTAARTTTDAPTLSESLNRTFIGSRTTTDALALAEVAVASRTFIRSVADALTLSESPSQSSVWNRATADATTLSEAISRSFVGSRAAIDALALSETATASKGTASISVNPSSISTNQTGVVLTVTGVNTTWLSVGPSFSFSGVAGLSITSTVVIDDTHATITVNSGSAAGIATLTDATSGAQTLLFVVSVAQGGSGGGATPAGSEYAYPLRQTRLTPITRPQTRKSTVAVEFDLSATASSEVSFPLLEASASAEATWTVYGETKSRRHDRTDWIRRLDDAYLLGEAMPV